MRERFAITDFNSGIINRADAEDILENTAIDSNNIDGDAPEGQLQAIPIALTKPNSNNLAQASRLFEWIKTKDTKWHLVHVDSANINVMADFYHATAPTAGITPVACVATSMVAHNEEVHVAVGTATLGAPTFPNWTGYCDYGQFGGATLGWKSLGTSATSCASLTRPTSTLDYLVGLTGHTVTPPAVTPFLADKIYHYNVSFVYDGVQETPMGTGYQSFSISTYGANPDYVTVVVTLYAVASLNPRVTGVRLYKREADPSTGLPITLYRLQQEFNVASSTAYGSTSWVTSGPDKTVTYLDYNNADSPSSYEDNAGIAESLISNDVYYTLNTDLNGFHFVAGCLKTGLPDASMMMFRSKQYRYDMFNWTNDYLKLPSVPTALKAFAGKIWAFDENHLYRINPDGMYIEDSTEGIGCLSQRSVIVTDYGMFWCDDKNAYWHDGEKIVPIGDAIKTNYGATAQWTGFACNYTRGSQFLTTCVVFHAPKNYVMFIVPDHTSAISNVWAFHVQKKRWDKWTSFTQCGQTTSGFGAFSGKGGEVYISTGIPAGGSGLLVEAFGGATWRSFYWTSKIFDFEQPARLKRIKTINTDNTATTSAPAFTYSFDRSGSFASFSAITQCRLMQVKITEATGYGNIIYSFEILFRRLSEL